PAMLHTGTPAAFQFSRLVPFQADEEGAVRRVPEVSGAVLCCRGDQSSIFAPCEVANRVGVPQGQKDHAIGRVDDVERTGILPPNRAIPPSGENSTCEQVPSCSN